MTTDRLVSAAAYGDRYDKPISRVLHHHRGHDPLRLRELNSQCRQMLSVSPASFVFDYSPRGMRVGAASRIAETSNKNLYSVCGWTPYRFFLELFRCPIGDPRLRSALVADLPLPQLFVTAQGAFDERG